MGFKAEKLIGSIAQLRIPKRCISSSVQDYTCANGRPCSHFRGLDDGATAMHCNRVATGAFSGQAAKRIGLLGAIIWSHRQIDPLLWQPPHSPISTYCTTAVFTDSEPPMRTLPPPFERKTQRNGRQCKRRPKQAFQSRQARPKGYILQPVPLEEAEMRPESALSPLCPTRRGSFVHKLHDDADSLDTSPDLTERTLTKAGHRQNHHHRESPAGRALQCQRCPGFLRLFVLWPSSCGENPERGRLRPPLRHISRPGHAAVLSGRVEPFRPGLGPAWRAASSKVDGRSPGKLVPCRSQLVARGRS